MSAKVTMEIREARESDIVSIVELLKISLGESLMPKSEVFWRWKHIDNPFGKSPVLLATDNDQLIGVRAFMKWEWRQKDKIYKAVRAVDTATHPQHQGKGIFKKLTLQLVDQCDLDKVDFIFNTPNKSSKPGYLKMGWQEVGRLKTHVRPIVNLKKQSSDFESEFTLTKARCANLFMSDERYTLDICTQLSSDYLMWRYVSNPNISYYHLNNSKEGYSVIFRLKPGRWGVEFRVCELMLTSKTSQALLRKQLLRAARASGASFISFAGRSFPMLSVALPIGPVVTVRPFGTHNSLTFERWKPSLGDLEVF